MVRTGDGGVRISGGKSSKKGGGGGGSRSGTPSKRCGGGDNRLGVAAQRDTPNWQKPITNFFNMPVKVKTEVGEGSDSQESKVMSGDMAVAEEVTVKTEIDDEDKENSDN